jgi:hypothetical protein
MVKVFFMFTMIEQLFDEAIYGTTKKIQRNVCFDTKTKVIEKEN